MTLFSYLGKNQSLGFIRQRSTQELRAFVERKLSSEALQNESLFD